MPKLYRISKNVFTLLPRRDIFSNANVTIIKDRKNALIDCGSKKDPGTRYLTRIFKSLGIESIDKIIITHSHVDHCQNAGDLAEKFGAEIIAHVNAVPILKRTDEISIDTFEFWELIEETYPLIMRGRFSWLYRRLIVLGYNLLMYGQGKKIEEITAVQEGDTIELGRTILEVIFTPGHSSDSISLLDRKQKIIFTGDMIAWTPYIHTTIDDFRHSIKKILSRSNDIKLAVRGHGRPHRWEGLERENYQEFLEDMAVAEKRIIALLKRYGTMTAQQMLSSVFRRSHFVHQLTYRIFMKTQQFWIKKYLENLENKNMIKSNKQGMKTWYTLA